MTNQVTVSSKGIGKIDKDPDNRLDYPLRFGDWVPTGDEILSVAFIITGTMTVYNFSVENDTYAVDYAYLSPAPPAVNNVTNTMVWLWLEGGTLDETEEIVTRITTVQGRIFDRTLQVKMRKF